MYLRSLRLIRFCGFEDFTLEFGDFTALIGPNNGGKTTILRAIKLLFTVIQSEQFTNALKASRQAVTNAFKAHEDRVAKLEASQPSNRNHQLDTSQKQLDGARKNALQQLRNSINLSQLAASQGFANISSFAFGHNTDAGFNINLNLNIDNADVTIVATFQAGSLGIDVLTKEGSLITHVDPQTEQILNKLLQLKVELVSSTSVPLVPTEQSLSWPQIKQRVESGRGYEVWRNRIHWLSEGKPPQRYQRVIDRVRTSLPDVALNSPARTKGQQPNVTLTYNEHGKEYDISESGGGFRTVLDLTTTIELADADILLFDEPDSHLHSSIQKQIAEFLVSSANERKQIVVSTHAPDIIEEFPLASLFWIDRNKSSAAPADSLTEALVALGVADHRQAFHLLGAKAHLYFENKPDERVLSQLLRRCGYEALTSSARAIRLHGVGDAKHLSTFARLVESHFKTRIPMAAILDADYEPGAEPTRDGLLLTARLPCKELENLLLLQPKAIFERLLKAAEASKRPLKLTLKDLDHLIDSETGAGNVTETVRLNWVAKRCPTDRQPDAGELRDLEEQFKKVWLDPQFRRRFTPGKRVLTSIKRKIQEATGLSFTNDSVFASYDPPEDVRRVFAAVNDHVQELLSVKPESRTAAKPL